VSILSGGELLGSERPHSPAGQPRAGVLWTGDVPLGVDAAGNVYQYQSSDGTSWSQSQVTGRQVRQLSVAADNTVCGLDSQGAVWQCDPDTNVWRQMTGGPLVQISCGSSNSIWGVDSTSKVWQHTTSWAQASGSMKQVSAAYDGPAWATGTDGYVYRYANTAWTRLAV
jgi:Tectonin domain